MVGQEGVLLAEQLLPSVVALVAHVDYRLEDGKSALKLLVVYLIGILEHNSFGLLQVNGCQDLGLFF